MLKELKSIGTFIVTEIAKELAKKDKKASGKLLKSLRSEVNSTSDGFEIAIIALSYFKFVDRGVNGTQRNNGSPYSYRSKKPPIEPLLEWVKTRAIATGDRQALSAAFAIQTHIWKNGVKGINFLGEFLKSGLDDSMDKIADLMANQVTTKIDSIIK